MKRFAVAALAGLAAAGVAFASAAGLSVTTASLGSGSVGLSTCDPDGVTTSFVTGFDSTLGYTVSSVLVSGISASCAGRGLNVALTDGTDKMVAQGGPGTVPVDGGSVTVTVSPTVAVPSVVRVHAVIS